MHVTSQVKQPSLADLGGMPGARHPLWDPILLFSHTFSPKSTRVRGPCPPNGCTPPLREILDPPLALMWAAYNGDKNCVDMLINAEADVNVRNQYGISALTTTAWENHEKCVQSLLKADSDIHTEALLKVM